MAAWSGAAMLVVVLANNPAYRTLVLAAAALAVAAAGRRVRPLAAGLGAAAASATLLNFGLSHLGADVLFALPDGWPLLGGPYTLEALVFGAATGGALAAAVLAAAPLSLLLEPHELLDALPGWLARSGTLVSTSLNLVPTIARSFTAVTEAQRMRGWRPAGPRSWAEVAVPVLLTTIEDSTQLAEAMAARGYGSGPRTHYARGGWTLPDRVVAASAGSAAVLFLLLRAAGRVADWQPYPTLSAPAVDPAAAAACLLLFVGPLTWRWQRSRR